MLIRTANAFLLVTVIFIANIPGARSDDRNEQWQRAMKALNKENRPLEALTQFESLAGTGWMHTNTLAQFYAITGDLIETESLAFAAIPQDTADPATVIDCSKYRRIPALQAIDSIARDRSVAMLNESHHSPLHRAFSTQIINRLKVRGFTHFGAETFDGNTLERTFQHQASMSDLGAYTTEPVFGDLVRQSLRLGYTLFAYEQRPDQLPEGLDQETARAVREQAQAANIKKLLDENPQARLIIHAGGSHVSKLASEQSSPMMAYRFMKLSGIEPVSIDQTGGTPSSARKFQSAVYRGVERCGQIRFPMVMVDPEGQYLAREGYDVTVFFPHADYSIGGRPDWLESMTMRRFLTINIQPDNERTLIRAFVEGEPANAVAMDHMLALPNADQVTLALPVGQYRLIREWNDGRDVYIGLLDGDAYKNARSLRLQHLLLSYGQRFTSIALSIADLACPATLLINSIIELSASFEIVWS